MEHVNHLLHVVAVHTEHIFGQLDEEGTLVVYEGAHIQDTDHQVFTVHCQTCSEYLEIPRHWRSNHCLPDCSHTIGEFGAVEQ